MASYTDLQNFSVIDREMIVEGAISSKGNLVIKGKASGTLTGESVVIAEEGSVFAEAKVTDMTIGGKFDGELTATGELIILSTGNCSGKVACKNLTIEKGGILNASVTHIFT